MSKALPFACLVLPCLPAACNENPRQLQKGIILVAPAPPTESKEKRDLLAENQFCQDKTDGVLISLTNVIFISVIYIANMQYFIANQKNCHVCRTYGFFDFTILLRRFLVSFGKKNFLAGEVSFTYFAVFAMLEICPYSKSKEFSSKGLGCNLVKLKRDVRESLQ